MSDSGGREVPAGPWPTPLTLRVLIDGPDHDGNVATIGLLAAAYGSAVVPVLDAQNRPVAQWTTFEAAGPGGLPMQCDVVVGLPDLSNAGRQSLARAADAVVIGLDTTTDGLDAGARLLRSESIRSASNRLVIIGRRRGPDDGITSTSLLAALGQEMATPAVVAGISPVEMSEGFTLAVTVGLDRLRWMGSAASSRRSFSAALLTTMVRAATAGTASPDRPVFASGTSAAIPAGPALDRPRRTETAATEPQPTGPLPITETPATEPQPTGPLPITETPAAAGADPDEARTSSLFAPTGTPAGAERAGGTLFLMPTGSGTDVPSGHLFVGPEHGSPPSGRPLSVHSDPTGPIAVTPPIGIDHNDQDLSDHDQSDHEPPDVLATTGPATGTTPGASPEATAFPEAAALLAAPRMFAEPTGPLPRITAPDPEARRRRLVGRRGGHRHERDQKLPGHTDAPAPTANVAPLVAPGPTGTDQSHGYTRPLFMADRSETVAARRSRLFADDAAETWPWPDSEDPVGEAAAEHDPVLVPVGGGADHEVPDLGSPAARSARVTTEARALEVALAHQLPANEESDARPAPGAVPVPDHHGLQRPEDDPILAEILAQSTRGKPILTSGVMIALLVTTVTMVIGLVLNS